MAAPGRLEHEQLFKDVTEMVREYLLKYGQRSSKVHYFILYNYIHVHVYAGDRVKHCAMGMPQIRMLIVPWLRGSNTRAVHP